MKNTKSLKKIAHTHKKGSVAIAQINTLPGNIELNAKNIVQYIKHAQNLEIETVVFPQFALTGFPLEDSIGHFPIIGQNCLKWINEIAKITHNITVILGFHELAENKTNYYNSIAIIKDGKISNIIRKDYSDEKTKFNDDKYIIPFKSPEQNRSNSKYLSNFGYIDVNNKKYAVTFLDNILNSNFIEKLSIERPDAIILCGANARGVETEQLYTSKMAHISKKYSIPLIYANQVGYADNASFDGISKIFNKNGELVARANALEEKFLIANPFTNYGEIFPLPSGYEIHKQNSFSLDYEYDMERTYKTVIHGIKDYFSKTGFKKAVLGLSGGLDSTVCAVLLADALGAENVLGISMPSKITSKESKSDAKKLAENLGINFIETPIKEIYNSINSIMQKSFDEIENLWDSRYKQSYTSDNIQARSRAMILWGISNEFGNTLPIATSDKSEKYVGYATINGDMSGGFAPIADITKTKLFALAKWLNKNRKIKNSIPKSIILKKPGAELAIDPKTGKPLIAEDALMPYEFLDEIIWRIENKHESYNDMLNSKFLYENNKNISQKQKVEWLDKFYRRMSASFYKWSILPPFVIVDAKEHNYKQPIVSSNISYKETDVKYIKDIIKNI